MSEAKLERPMPMGRTRHDNFMLQSITRMHIEFFSPERKWSTQRVCEDCFALRGLPMIEYFW